jgi:hypothetical protein
MLDTLGILFSTFMILIVVFNAVRRDRSDPWFQTLKRDAAVPAKPPAPEWRR